MAGVIQPLRHQWIKAFTPWCCARGACAVFFDPTTKRYFDGATMDQGDQWKETAPICRP